MNDKTEFSEPPEGFDYSEFRAQYLRELCNAFQIPPGYFAKYLAEIRFNGDVIALIAVANDYAALGKKN